jgi:hypothetical protein
MARRIINRIDPSNPYHSNLLKEWIEQRFITAQHLFHEIAEKSARLELYTEQASEEYQNAIPGAEKIKAWFERLQQQIQIRKLSTFEAADSPEKGLGSILRVIISEGANEPSTTILQDCQNWIS